MALKGSSCGSWVTAAARRLGGFVDRHGSLGLCVVLLLLAGVEEVGAQGAAATTTAAADTPWGMAALGFCGLMVGIVGKAMAVVAVIIAGVTYAIGEGASKTMLASVIFGSGLVLMAPAMLSFFFGDVGVTIAGGMCTIT